MAYLQGSYLIVDRKELAEGIYDYIVHCPDIAAQAKPGQFVHIRVPGFTLRRPISICEVLGESGCLRLVFEVRGAGTKQLSALGQTQKMDLLGPLGNGFRLLSPDKSVVFVGGGIGTPPLLETAKPFGENATVLLGFRTDSAVILESDFRAAGCNVQIATEDGSTGCCRGYVGELLERRLAQGAADMIYACGPTPMLKAVVELAQAHGVPSQVSLEERMACGVGACLVCACKVVRRGKEMNLRVCKDGPVFDGREVVFA